MLDLRVSYSGGGQFQARTRMDFELCQSFTVGEELRAKVGRKRSVRQNDFFHGLCEAAFENQRGGPSLPTWRHLKSHLLIAAGHCEEARIGLKRLPGDDVAAFVAPFAAALRRQFETVEVSYDQRRHEVVMRFAKSWKFEKADGDVAKAITARVVEIICSDIVPGVSPEALMDMAKEKAR